MKLIPVFALASLAVAAPDDGGRSTPQSVADELAAADRAFSSAGARASLADSIGAMLVPNAVMPTPKRDFAIGRDAIVAALRANPTATGDWAPVRVGISADGTQGFTYGFMTIRETGKPDRRAKYLSYWVKRPEGWRVAFYKRAGSGEGEVSTEAREAALPEALVSPDPRRVQEHLSALKDTEKAFSDRAQAIGLGPAFVDFGAPDAMNMGRGADFTFGNDNIGAEIGGNAPNSPFYWSADKGALVASSGDLGVTWGFVRQHEPKEGEPAAFPFFTVWRKAAPDRPWRYVAE